MMLRTRTWNSSVNHVESCVPAIYAPVPNEVAIGKNHACNVRFEKSIVLGPVLIGSLNAGKKSTIKR